jgi:glycosyltransferase involved in cell wall biosynthesis
MITLPNVSLVVIGKNEEENLIKTFDAILQLNYPKDRYEIIYVDTGSTDKSVAIAGEYTENVFNENSSWPTPGLARNRGIIEAKYDIIHFIDGDIRIDKNYLKKAVVKIQEPKIDAVYGYLDEKSEGGINEILLTHWKGKQEGFHKSSGGGGTYKKAALFAIDGYDERIRKGQETELGERFIKAGYKIWFIDERMGVHDYGVDSVKDLFKIFFLDGINKSHSHLTNGNTNYYKINRIRAINNIIFTIVIIILLSISIYLWSYLGIILTIIIYYLYFIMKYLLIRKVNNIQELKYYLLMYSMRCVTISGQLAFYLKCIIYNRYYKSVIKPKQSLS